MRLKLLGIYELGVYLNVCCLNYADKIISKEAHPVHKLYTMGHIVNRMNIRENS